MVGAMLNRPLLLSIFMLCGCASAPPPQPPGATRAETVRATPRAGTDEAALIARYGAPAVVRRDGRGVMMTWTAPACSLVAVLTDGRLAGLDVLPETARDTCPAAIAAQR
jgi:hypothetical protein